MDEELSLIVHQSQATLSHYDTVVWSSSDEWLVQDGLAADIDRDGNDELVLLTWRQGDYGTSRPFWEDEPSDAQAWTQHLFVMSPEIDEDGACTLRPVWMTSKLDMGVQSISYQNGRLRLWQRDGVASLWEWSSWGLSLVDDDPRAMGSGTGASRLEFSRIVDPYPTNMEHHDGELSLLVSGDVICHESMYRQAWNGDTSYDFSPLFGELQPYLDSYDINVACEETILVHDPSEVSTYPFFGTPYQLGDALASAGYDVVCAATNHAVDKGEKGIEDTMLFWQNNHPEIALLGLHQGTWIQPVTSLKKNGFTVAFVNATESLNFQKLPSTAHVVIDTFERLPLLLSEVREASRMVDLTVCVLHTGIEYASEPSLVQRIVANRFLDAGADIVVCSHSHVLQPVERITTSTGRSGIVYWSLGNLISHQTGALTVLGGIANVTISRNDDGETTIRSYGLTPVVAHFDKNTTHSYLLRDYTTELAAEHSLNRINPNTVTLTSLRSQWEQVKEKCQ